MSNVFGSCIDILKLILLSDINLYAVLSIASITTNMRAIMRRTFRHPIELPLHREFTDEDYLAIILRGALPKEVVKYYHKKAIIEGYFPIIRDFASFSRKITIGEFVDIISDVSPLNEDTINLRPVIPRRTKQEIATFFRDDTNRTPRYIIGHLDKHYLLVNVAYNFLHENGNYLIANSYSEKYTMMFTNCRTDIIYAILGDKCSYTQEIYEKRYFRKNGGIFYCKPNINRLFFPNIHRSNFKIIMRTHSEDELVNIINNCRLNRLSVLSWYETVIMTNNYDLIESLHNQLDDIDTRAIVYSKMVSMAKAAFNVKALEMLGEKCEWLKPNTKKKYNNFIEKIELINV